MKINRVERKLPGVSYYLVHLGLINCVVDNKLSEKELEVLGHFMALDKNITGTDMFNTYARKLVKQNLGEMSSASLSNHLKILKEKGYVVEDDLGRLKIVDYLFPEETWQGYQIKLIKE